MMLHRAPACTSQCLWYNGVGKHAADRKQQERIEESQQAMLATHLSPGPQALLCCVIEVVQRACLIGQCPLQQLCGVQLLAALGWTAPQLLQDVLNPLLAVQQLLQGCWAGVVCIC